MEIQDTASSPENMVHFTDVELAPVVRALTTKLFRRSSESYEVRVVKFQAMFTALSEVFGIPEVKVVGVVERQMGYLDFEPGGNTVATEKHLSLVTCLHGFAMALLHHKPELRAQIDPATFEQTAPGLRPDGFALSMFKQAAPQMFEEAKNRGRLYGTSVPYTDDGRLTQDGQVRGAEEAPSTGEDAAPEGATTDLPPAPPAHRPVQPPQRPPVQRPDIDPENRDRGNGRGED